MYTNDYRSETYWNRGNSRKTSRLLFKACLPNSMFVMECATFWHDSKQYGYYTQLICGFVYTCGKGSFLRRSFHSFQSFFVNQILIAQSLNLRWNLNFNTNLHDLCLCILNSCPKTLLIKSLLSLHHTLETAFLHFSFSWNKGFRPGPTQTGLRNYWIWLEA